MKRLKCKPMTVAAFKRWAEEQVEEPEPRPSHRTPVHTPDAKLTDRPKTPFAEWAYPYD